MNEEFIRHLFDACFYGKQITELLPSLPPNMKSRHIQVIDIIYELQERQEEVRVSDVSGALRITKPSVTKLINELVMVGAVAKQANQKDRRVTTVSLTALGTTYYEMYIREYHSRLVKILAPLSEQDCLATLRTLKNMYWLMKQQPIVLTDQH
jgi:DNA-binding MarR family transcriptional regulator